MAKKVAYIRTSTGKQVLGIEVQREALKGYNPDEFYIEQISGRKVKRPKFDEMMASLNSGDTIIVYKLDRLGRSTKQLVNLVSELEERGISLIIIKEGLDTTSSTGKLIFTILSAVAEMEASLISERTREALAVSEKKGGRPKINEDELKKAIHLYTTTTLTTKQIVKQCDLSLTTLFNYLKKENISRRR